MIFNKHSGYRADGRRVLPFGGDKQQNTTATTNTTDARQVNTTTTTVNDLSARDSNNQSNSNNTYLTDGGAIDGMAKVALAAGSNALDQIKAAFGLATTVANGANAATVSGYDYADGLFHASLDAMQSNDTKAYDAWSRAALMEENALKASNTASSSALSTLQNAYADAKGTTQANQQMVFMLAGVAGLAILMSRKG